MADELSEMARRAIQNIRDEAAQPLRAEIKRLRNRIVVLEATNEIAYRPHRILVESRDNEVKRREAAEADRDRLRAALEWYANSTNYHSGRMVPGGHAYQHEIMWDGGERARAALAGGASNGDERHG